ncbi:aldehyde dehydrogenase family protein [Salicibibacter cibarius]|uniref:Aldehyde dehydrogenase family protein n=1 Tax=Salicibibacter cibarius TaxID=2743000 RepID=A0A7T7CA36_9BACI|nr:aldehyde dehydrogenase family protein [Salicibibacter cibarius]QQK74448.1 aldehyde dehydrogenase family protein [Salicibibacter cibarius]
MAKTLLPNVSGNYLMNGELKQTQDVKSVINPAKTDEIVGKVALCTEKDVREAVSVADEAYQTWSQTKITDRAERMRKASETLGEIVEENVSLFVRENGKTMVEAKKDILRCVEIMHQLAETSVEWWKPIPLDGHGQNVSIRRRPRGVTAVISPWNSPMILTFKRLIPALLAGNTVVVKPATNCPLTVLTSLAAIANQFPPGVINVVTGSGEMVGDLLSSDSRVRAIAFTGGTETGKEIMARSSSTIKNLYMELGGNDPALILPDAALDDQEIQKLHGAILRSAGQVCSAVKRIYVHESRHDEIVEKLTKSFEKVVVGNGLQPDAMMGPLNNESQYKYVMELLKRTEENGSKVNTVGVKLDSESWEDGYFVLPSIVTDISHDAELTQAEQFGPVIPIIPYTDLEDAIRKANDSPFGLRASVWTSSRENAISIADRLEAGAVFHNNHTIFNNLHLDFAGTKESGMNRETQWGNLDLFADSYGFSN